MAPAQTLPSVQIQTMAQGAVERAHRMQRGKEVTEVDEMGRHAVKKRALKSNRKKNIRTDNGDDKLYYGNRGRYFYFQCLQLILRHQVAVLIERWALPPELEVVCRDLWALHLSLLRNPPPAEPALAAHESQDEGEVDPSASTPKRERKSSFQDSDLDLDSNSKEEDPKPPSSGDEDDDDDDDVKAEVATDPELDDLLAENSASESSSSDGENKTDDDKNKFVPRTKRTKKAGLARFEQPANTLAVIVLACWTLRIPILYRDLTQLIESYELPYLEATRVLPQSMTMHLTRYNIQALSPPKTPNTLAMHNLASSLARRLHLSFGVKTPEVNAAPILWRIVTQCLGGTPTLYRLTKRLSAVLSLPLTLHNSLAPRLKRVKRYDVESHKFDNVAPEVAFVTTGIIVLKLVYGLDGKERLPVHSEDPASDLPRIDEYLELLGRLNDADSNTRSAEFDSRTAMAIEDLSEDRVDEYLAFCERALVGSENDVLERFFPLPTPQTKFPLPKGASAGEQVQLRATGLQDREEEALRPGEGYTLGDGG
ncbi:hypothetical protein MVEN_01237500 [Mycena venus]|uniref:Uncharacterized protein n=1 Tax=Mycena venus TaxID=2733690 RepID=A0A8H6Y6E7_9AGAR|nr:hypothetical protein MVEN_01237500 [Mycena venus]